MVKNKLKHRKNLFAALLLFCFTLFNSFPAYAFNPEDNQILISNTLQAVFNISEEKPSDDDPVDLMPPKIIGFNAYNTTTPATIEIQFDEEIFIDEDLLLEHFLIGEKYGDIESGNIDSINLESTAGKSTINIILNDKLSDFDKNNLLVECSGFESEEGIKDKHGNLLSSFSIDFGNYVLFSINTPDQMALYNGYEHPVLVNQSSEPVKLFFEPYINGQLLTTADSIQIVDYHDELGAPDSKPVFIDENSNKMYVEILTLGEAPIHRINIIHGEGSQFNEQILLVVRGELDVFEEPSNNSIYLSWAGFPFVDSYCIYVDEVNITNISWEDTLHYTITDLQPNTTYNIEIIAVAERLGVVASKRIPITTLD